MDPSHIHLMWTRRAVLRGVMALVGGAATALPIDLWAEATPATRFFSQAEFALLDEVCEIIIPQTDTPGARGAGVAAAFDALLRQWASTEHQQQFRALLYALDAAAVAKGGQPLLQLTPYQRLEVITAYDVEHHQQAPYSSFKDLVLKLYYLSEIGATQELRYEHVPGAWEPSVKITPGTRAWASPS